GSTVKSTPSTALTQATRRHGKTPLTLGKCLARPSASSSGGMGRLIGLRDTRRGPPAARAPAVGDAHVVGRGVGAVWEGLRAPRVERAPPRQRGGGGRRGGGRGPRLPAGGRRPRPAQP